MAATLTVEKTAAASVPTPPADRVRFFVDTADNLLKYKDELGVVRSANLDVASALLTADTPNPIVVDGSTPVAGNIFVADSPILGTWRAPSAALGGLVLLDSTVPRTALFTAALGRLYLCDVSGGSFTATLPLANASSANHEIWFKLVGLNGGNVLTIDGAGAETIDVSEASIQATLDREWVKLRSCGNGNWVQVG